MLFLKVTKKHVLFGSFDQLIIPGGNMTKFSSGYDEQKGDQKEHREIKKTNCCDQVSQWMQNKSYQVMAFTIWDNMIGGFKPGRIRAFELMDIKPGDTILLVGEGSGLDFECLPKSVDKSRVKAFDFSSEMVKQSKKKAKLVGIPEENCFEGDAQNMSFLKEKFNKILFPLSLASIPNPTLALQEAERCLEPHGKIIIFDKMVDEGASISRGRYTLNFFTKCVFADINRSLPTILGKESPLKITHYESLQNKLDGYFAGTIGTYYRLAVLVRKTEYTDQPAIAAKSHA